MGLASTGLHTNGYSLARRIVFGELGLRVDSVVAELGGATIGEALLAVHRSYLKAMEPLLAEIKAFLKAVGERSRPVVSLEEGRRALEVAAEHQLRSLAFPSISTGIYGYPMEEAARIALGTIINYLGEHPEIELVRYVLYDSRALEMHQRVLEQVTTRRE